MNRKTFQPLLSTMKSYERRDNKKRSWVINSTNVTLDMADENPLELIGYSRGNFPLDSYRGGTSYWRSNGISFIPIKLGSGFEHDFPFPPRVFFFPSRFPFGSPRDLITPTHEYLILYYVKRGGTRDFRVRSQSHSSWQAIILFLAWFFANFITLYDPCELVIFYTK